MPEDMIDYTADYNRSTVNPALMCHGKGNNVLILHHLDEPRKRFDGKKATYAVEYRWLSEECKTPTDEAWCMVQGSEFTLWQRKEFDIASLKNGSQSLFDQFALIS